MRTCRDKGMATSIHEHSHSDKYIWHSFWVTNDKQPVKLLTCSDRGPHITSNGDNLVGRHLLRAEFTRELGEGIGAIACWSHRFFSDPRSSGSSPDRVLRLRAASMQLAELRLPGPLLSAMIV